MFFKHVNPHDTRVEVELVRDDAAHALAADPEFRARWTRLAAACPWATAFQSPAFVGCWYRSYRDTFRPILVIARDAAGLLQGLLPLALHVPNQHLVVAGAWQAEYHAWICPPHLGDVFPAAAARLLRRLMPARGLKFRYLPPGTPTAWLCEERAAATALLVPHRRPLMTLGDGAEVRSSLAKPGNKSKIKRLEKLGRLEFKRLTDPDEFEAHLDEIIAAYDTRRMALNGIAPFRDDPHKRAFHVAMMREPGLLHATITKVGGRLAAAHVGACGARELQLGINAHHPSLGRHSPGKLHILFLARMLLDEGAERIDLTAGGDPYKERFANAWDEVHTLQLFPNALHRRRAAVVARAERGARRLLKEWDVTPARAMAWMQAFSIGHLTRRLTAAGDRLAADGPTPAAGVVFRCDVAATPVAGATTQVRTDPLVDLLQYEPRRDGPSRQAFVADALDRLEAGQRLCTVAGPRRPPLYAWLAGRPSTDAAAMMLPGGIRLPEGAAIVEIGALQRPITADDWARAMTASLREAAACGTTCVYVLVPSHRPDLHAAAESTGFARVAAQTQAATASATG